MAKAMTLDAAQAEAARDEAPPDEHGCERFWMAPWLYCPASAQWTFYAVPCEMHPDLCTGHHFCHDHAVTTLGDPQRREPIHLIRRIDR